MTENEHKFVEALRKGLSFDAIAEKMCDCQIPPDEDELGRVMVGMRKVMWRIVGEQFPEYEIGVPLALINAIDCTDNECKSNHMLAAIRNKPCPDCKDDSWVVEL